MKIQEKNWLFFLNILLCKNSCSKMKCISHQCFNWMVTIHPYSRHTQMHQLSLCWLWPWHLTSLEQRLAVRARRLIQQQKENVSWQWETFRKGLNVTSGAQLMAALPLVKPVVWFVLTVVNWCSCSVAKSAHYYLHSTALYTYFLHCSMSRGNVVSQTCQT